MEDQPQSKRKRRPSVRLGEIGFAGLYDASEMWMEAPRQGKKLLGKKALRIRSLENVGQKAVVVPEEEWSVDEPAVASADEEKMVVDGTGPVSTLVKESQHVKLRTGSSALKTQRDVRAKGQGLGECRLAWNVSRVRWKHQEASRAGPVADADLAEKEEEKEGLPLQADDEALFLAGTTSDSEELERNVLNEEEGELPAGDYGNGASERSAQGDAGANPNSPCNSGDFVAKQQRCIIIIPANPNSNGDEMQGGIEDGPGQAAGKGSSTVKQREGEWRSGRQAARRSNRSGDTISRDRSRDAVSGDIAGEPSGRFQALPSATNGAIGATPSSSQRLTSLSAGVSEWLQNLGLGKYSVLFELNEVDAEVLPLLTMNDLREMGVDAVGARRKMFTHIQELGHLRGV
ncbi:hypothetical protein KC19_VG309000 [Ceratodon purpureus]|uniref:SAM domain-containing protein n=1 Tax=Ceratodon purpureus TaxID=3225 RepID=A0A8T0HX11_CERPU|nr:hypothetical protein KC19_VG309000 [Ceratodon purpureus]